MKNNFKIFAVLFVLAVFTLACGSDAGVTAEKVGDATEMATAAPVVQVFEIGDIIQVGDLKLTVNEFTFTNGNDVFQPDPGKRFAYVDMTIENTGSSSASISTLMQMELKDSTGLSYDVDFSALTASDLSSIDGEIVPGEKTRGIAGFQVGNDANGFQFVFEPGLFSSGKVFVNLGQ